MTEGEARRNMKKMGCSLWKASAQIQLVVDGERIKKAAIECPMSTRLTQPLPPGRVSNPKSTWPEISDSLSLGLFSHLPT